MKSSLILAVLLSTLLLTSCVASRKYKDALAREQALSEQNAGLNSNLSKCNSDLAALNTRFTDAQAENARLINQVDAAGKNAAELGKLANKTQEQLQQEQQRLKEEQERLARMQQLMDQQRQAIEGLRQSMSKALVNFKPEELTVSIKNGKVYVSLQESLLFPSGSAEVNPRGKEALGKLAQALNTNPDISVQIEGHTDSIPIRGRYEDNWALSTARSTSIVRILTNTYKLDPVRISASGRSEYEPIESNATAEGRARNRRTEIILAPKLDELMKLLEGTPTSGQ